MLAFETDLERERTMLTPISSFAAPYTMNVLIVQQLPIFYDQPWSAGSSIPLEKAARENRIDTLTLHSLFFFVQTSDTRS